MNNFIKKPILVTGGAGFIGSHLIDRLLAEGCTVVCLDNLNDFYNPEIKRLNQNSHFDYNNYTFIETDIRQKDLVNDIFKRHHFGMVIHLAAMAGVRPSVENPMLYSDVNIAGTQILLDASREHGVEKFIFASSSSVYGNNRKTPFAENDIVDRQVSPYGATKKMGEILCYPYTHLFGLSVVCLRFFTVYGPRQRPEMAIHKFVRKMRRGDSFPFYGDGSMARDYTYIDDIVHGIFQAMKGKEDYNIYNLGNSEPVKLSELVEVIEKATGVSAIKDMQLVPPGDVEQTFADISRAKQRLDYTPTTRIDEGMALFVDWFDQQCQNHGELYR